MTLCQTVAWLGSDSNIRKQGNEDLGACINMIMEHCPFLLACSAFWMT